MWQDCPASGLLSLMKALLANEALHTHCDCRCSSDNERWPPGCVAHLISPGLLRRRPRKKWRRPPARPLPRPARRSSADVRQRLPRLPRLERRELVVLRA